MDTFANTLGSVVLAPADIFNEPTAVLTTTPFKVTTALEYAFTIPLLDVADCPIKVVEAFLTPIPVITPTEAVLPTPSKVVPTDTDTFKVPTLEELNTPDIVVVALRTPSAVIFPTALVEVTPTKVVLPDPLASAVIIPTVEVELTPLSVAAAEVDTPRIPIEEVADTPPKVTIAEL